MRPVDVWYTYRHAGEVYTHTVAATAGAGIARYALTGNPSTLRYAGKMASFAVRAHANAARGVLGTRLSMAGSRTLGGAIVRGAGAATAGYVIGAAVGTGISRIAFGEKGARDALDLYSSPTKFYDKAILGFGDNVSDILGHYL